MTIASRFRGTALAACSVIALSLAVLAPAPAQASTGFNIVNESGWCLGIKGGISTPGTLAVIWNCNSHPDQLWHWGAASPYGGNQLVNGLNQCLGVNGGDPNEGAYLVSYTCYSDSTKHPDQYWRAVAGTCGEKTLDNNGPNLNLVIGTQGGVTNENTPLVMWNYQDLCNNQMWVSTLFP